MSSLPHCPDVLAADDEVVPLDQAAQFLDIPVTRVHQLLQKRQLLAVVRDGQLAISALFFDGEGIARHIPGVLAVLDDGGYSGEEILRFLFTEDESLPGRPIEALHGHLAREVMRRAQAMAL